MIFDYEVVFEATRNLASGEESPRVHGVALNGHGCFYSSRAEETYDQNCKIWNEFLEALNEGKLQPWFQADMPDNFYFVEEINGLIRTRGRLNDFMAIRRNKESGKWVSEVIGVPQIIHLLPSPPECEELW